MPRIRSREFPLAASVQFLPRELRSLVKKSVAILGEVIRYEEGAQLYEFIENIRKDMASLRTAKREKIDRTLKLTHKKLLNRSRRDRSLVAHSFTLMLELMNACENAYRTYRLKQYPRKTYPKHPQAMIYVVTAHPTESRSPANIAIFHKIQKLLTELLIEDSTDRWTLLKTDLQLAWHISTGKVRRPQVSDEAEHIYSILLKEETLDALLSSRQEFGPIFIRSWVGGDKDGHPGVDEQTFKLSLTLSRKLLLKYFQDHLNQFKDDLDLARINSPEIIQPLQHIKRICLNLRNLSPHDGARVQDLHSRFKNLVEAQERLFLVRHPHLSQLRLLLQMFPALVVPLELREHSQLIQAGANGKETVIEKMLRQLASLSNGGNPRFYARGLIISMASSFRDIQDAATLVRKTLGGLKLPVIPLFEQENALKEAPLIVERVLNNPQFKRAIQQEWQGYFEVMLGYSDSAKELGVFASHLKIMEAVRHLDRLYHPYPVTPIFFHGSGGSTDRGGGSIEEQTEWWPKSALQLYKATIQGEMVERTFASFEITRRRFEQIVAQMNRLQMNRLTSRKHTHSLRKLQKVVFEFAEEVSKEYQRKVSSPEFLKIVFDATAYRYLSVLKIGSRPATRSKTVSDSISKLRTIPWVLCWTQTRALFPTWWGVGTAWKKIKHSGNYQRKAQILQKAFLEVPAFRSYIKILSSTLARVELPIFRFYLKSSDLPETLIDQIFDQFQREHKEAIEFVRTLSGKHNLVWFRPWFGASIHIRSPMIHPLNLLQIIAIQEKDFSLLRETVTGIASGMMTTG